MSAFPWTAAVVTHLDHRIELQIKTDLERTDMSRCDRGHEFVPGGGCLADYFAKLGRDTDIGNITSEQKVHIVHYLSARHIKRIAASVGYPERATVEMAITEAAVSTTEWTLGRLATNAKRHLNQLLKDAFEGRF